jgi:phosphoribosylformylglycinamidine synthase
MSQTATANAVRTILITTAGTNCDRELARAFALAGSIVQTVHINRLVAEPGILRNFQIMGIPGGFSYGDDIASGKIFANILVDHLHAPIRDWIEHGKLIIGICNGFQVLVKAGLLPGKLQPPGGPVRPSVTLTHNHHGRFEDRWVKLKSYSSICKWIPAGRELTLPVAHGEGRFAVAEPDVLDGLNRFDQIVLRYVDAAGRPTQQFPDNPNGSLDAIAGICDPSGRIFGLMPHPERFVTPYQHPSWTRFDDLPVPQGMEFFQNAVQWIRRSASIEIFDSAAAAT